METGAAGFHGAAGSSRAAEGHEVDVGLRAGVSRQRGGPKATVLEVCRRFSVRGGGTFLGQHERRLGAAPQAVNLRERNRSRAGQIEN